MKKGKYYHAPLTEDHWPILSDYQEIFNPDLQRSEYVGRTWNRRNAQLVARKDRRNGKRTEKSWWGEDLQTAIGFTRRGDERARELFSRPFFSELLDRRLR